ncbi:MAG TPA: hypothetical protein PLK61_10815 [Nitrosomonas sp.]|nr:hypothetical protein [Nitrosomonas sp.]
MKKTTSNFLLFGHDTVECAYYLRKVYGSSLDFEQLAIEKETLRQLKQPEPKVINLGGIEFLLQPYGSKSGFPFVISNQDFTISFGEFNNPSFFVKFRSLALWREGAIAMHQRFMQWAERLGLMPLKTEGLSRVDFSFDYHLPVIDFDEDNFVSLSVKDTQYRKDGKIQTFKLGESDVVLRIYDKVAEIEEQSGKSWFFELWGIAENVWRVEWQVRKDILKRFGIRTFADLQDGQGDVLRYLVTEHSTLREKIDDSNRSRWPLHPLWIDLQEQIDKLENQGIYREIDQQAILNERLMRMAISMYGYLKRIAAVHCLQTGQPMITDAEAMQRLENLISRVHEPMAWQADVVKRMDSIRLGQW